jgi:hypothetical protein
MPPRRKLRPLEDEGQAKIRGRGASFGSRFESSRALDSAREAQPDFVDKLGCKLGEASGERMRLVGPLGGIKRALRIDKGHFVGRVSREMGDGRFF